jgi:hypothetical protein
MTHFSTLALPPHGVVNHCLGCGYDLIAIDQVGYMPLADLGAEFFVQVVPERAENAAVIMTTNLPFSEWTRVDSRLPDSVRPCWTGSPSAR